MCEGTTLEGGVCRRACGGAPSLARAVRRCTMKDGARWECESARLSDLRPLDGDPRLKPYKNKYEVARLPLFPISITVRALPSSTYNENGLLYRMPTLVNRRGALFFTLEVSLGCNI